MSARPFLALVYALLLSAAGQASADQPENCVRFVATYGGQPVEGARVCLFRGTYANDPLVLFGQSDEVTCFDADRVLDLPPGLWNANVHRGEELISTQPDILIYEGRSDHYREIPVALSAAAVLDFSRLGAGKRGEHRGVWIANGREPRMPSVIRSVPRGTSRVLVPAGEIVVPLVIAGGRLLDIGDPITAAANKVTKVMPWNRRGRTLVTWVKMDWASYEQTNPDELSSLDIAYVGSDGVSRRPEFLRSGPSYELDLIVFRDLPAGRGVVKLTGETWIEQEIAIAESTAPLQPTFAPLTAFPAAAVELSWPLRTPPAGCTVAAPRVTLRRCDGTRGSCEQVAASTVATVETNLRAAFRSIIPGRYEAELAIAGLPVLRSPVHLQAGRSTVDVSLAPDRVIRGRITRGGESIQAMVMFATGGGWTDDSGLYTALVGAPPGREPVSLVLCSSGQDYVDVPASAVGAVYDIDVPATLVEVDVRSTSGAAIEDATVVATVYAASDARQVIANMTAPPTTADGRTQVFGLPPRAPIRLCAHRERFSDRCSETVILKDVKATTRVEITLPSALALRGRVNTSAAVEAGMLWSVSPTGGVTGRTTVAADGTFTVDRPWNGDEYLVFTSANHPLAVMAAARDGRELTLSFMGTPTRAEVVVESGERLTRFLGLMIDGRAIPAAALDQHTSYRGATAMIIQGASTTIPDLLVAHDVVVVLGPAPAEMAALGGRDWQFDPTLAGAFARRRAAPPVARVAF